MGHTKKIAFSGIITALSVVLMFLTAVIPFGTYAFAAIAGVLTILICIECDSKSAFCVFGAVAILAFLFVPDKISVLAYIVFLGYYPIVKQFIERISKLTIQYIIKFSLVNVAMAAAFLVGTYVLQIPMDLFYDWGFISFIIIILLANAIFFIYDIALTSLISVYVYKYRDKFNFLKK